MVYLPQLRRLTLSLATFAALAVGSAMTTYADTVFVVGNDTGSNATATVVSTFNSNTNTLNLSVTNTSPFDARITAIGFDLPPVGNSSSSGLNGFTGSTGNANFTFRNGNLGNVPQFNNAVLDFGFTTSNNGNFNGGSPNNGIAPGQSSTFIVSGQSFSGFTESQISSSIFVRFQRVGANGQGSDVGRPGPGPAPVPEPATMLLLGTGLAGVAAKIRRRRHAARQE